MLAGSLSAIAPLLLFQLRELRRALETGAQLRRAALRRLVVVELALDVEADPQHGRRRRLRREVTLYESARLQKITLLVRQLDHVEQRIGERRVARQGR